MSFVTFDVKQSGGPDIPDGFLQFSWTIASTPTGNQLSGTLSYKHTATATPKTLTTITNLPVNANGTYTPPNVTFSPQDEIHIPAAPPYGGGDYDTLSNMVFTPAAATPSASGTFTGTFSDSDGLRPTDSSCDWEAAVTTPLPQAVKKAPY